MKAQQFLETLSGKVTLIFHNDGDGVCSATLIYDYLKSRGLEVRLFSGDIEKRTFQNARVSENIIMTDLAIDQYPEFIEKFRDKNVLIIDHHPIKSDLNEVGFVHINPRIKDPDKYISASEICYDILKDITKPKEWLMKVGGVSDCSLKGSRREEKAAHTIAAIKAVKRSIYLSELVEHLSTCPSLNDFLANKEFKKIGKEFQDEVKRVMEEFKKEKHGDPIFFMIDSKYPMKSVISNILFEKYPKKTIFVYKEANNTYNISARSNKIDVGKLLKKITEGIGHGGGHPKAAAAYVNDITEFKKRLSKEFKKDIN